MDSLLQNEKAESLALRALTALIENEALRDGFLGSSGLSPEEVSQRAGDPEFLGFVLDFILEGDEAVIGLSQILEVAPEAFLEARASLPGGDTPLWT